MTCIYTGPKAATHWSTWLKPRQTPFFRRPSEARSTQVLYGAPLKGDQMGGGENLTMFLGGEVDTFIKKCQSARQCLNKKILQSRSKGQVRKECAMVQ